MFGQDAAGIETMRREGRGLRWDQHRHGNDVTERYFGPLSVSGPQSLGVVAVAGHAPAMGKRERGPLRTGKPHMP
jgi:hypothetical protein